MNPKMLELLYKSFDASLTPNEQEELERALIDSEQLREEKEKLTQMRESISSTAKNSFNPFFANRVMQRITSQKKESNEELFFESLISLFRPMAIAAVLLVVVLTSYNLVTDNFFSSQDSPPLSELSLEDAFDPMLDYLQE